MKEILTIDLAKALKSLPSLEAETVRVLAATLQEVIHSDFERHGKHCPLDDLAENEKLTSLTDPQLYAWCQALIELLQLTRCDQILEVVLLDGEKPQEGAH